MDLMKNAEFREFHEEVNEKTFLRQSEYIMDKYNILYFIEAILEDEDGKELICVNPVRIPAKEPKNPDHIFGTVFDNLTKIRIIGDIKKSRTLQTERRELLLKENNHPGLKDSEFFTGKFLPRDFVKYRFSPVKALKIMMEKEAKNLDHSKWFINYAAFWSIEKYGTSLDKLGVTGSSSFGILEEGEDVDIVYYGSAKEIINYRKQLCRFISKDKERECHEFGKFWPIRAWLAEDEDFANRVKKQIAQYHTIKKHDIKLNENKDFLEILKMFPDIEKYYNELIEKLKALKPKDVELCTFWVVNNPDDDYLYHSKIKIIRKDIKEVKAKVTNDDYNSFSPPSVELKDVEIVAEKGKEFIKQIPLIIFNGYYRGDYFEGEELQLTKPFMAEIIHQSGEKYNALLCFEWNSVNK